MNHEKIAQLARAMDDFCNKEIKKIEKKQKEQLSIQKEDISDNQFQREINIEKGVKKIFSEQEYYIEFSNNDDTLCQKKQPLNSFEKKFSGLSSLLN